jgi:hypothetical protein
MEKVPSTLFILFLTLALLPAVASVSATPNIGMLRVSSFLCPGEVAPGATFPVSLDVEYAIQGLPNNATIRGAIYSGSINSSSRLWESDPTLVSNGGDEVWNLTLTAPTSEGFFNITAYALFLDDGAWTYFSNPVNGPGFSRITVKIGKTANLDVNVGAPGIGVTVDGATEQTSHNGDASFVVAVASTAVVSLPPIVEFQNSTRIIFTQWSDAVQEPQRHVLIDGDISLTAYYKTQYLLRVNFGSKSEEWYDRGANATISALTPVPVAWPLSMLGVTQTFQGWSGDIHSSLPKLNVTMDSPKTITAEFNTDYRPLAVPAIFGLGIASAVISFVWIRRRSDGLEQGVTEATPDELVHESNPTCPTCGQETEQEWAHCIKCGTKLNSADRSTS